MDGSQSLDSAEDCAFKALTLHGRPYLEEGENGGWIGGGRQWGGRREDGEICGWCME